jgi:hypothetical protein
MDEYGNLQLLYDENGQPIDEYGNPVGPTQNVSYSPYANVTEGVDYGPMTETAGPPDPSLVRTGSGSSTIDDILTLTRNNKKEYQGIVDEWASQLPGLQGQADTANAGDTAAFDRLSGVLDAAKPIDYFQQQPDLTSEAALAQADPRARAAQFEMLDKLRGWSDPKVTAAERFMQLKARRSEEMDQRSSREAALRSMAARGVRSGGAEMAALLGGQQVSSQNRLMSDLGTQAMAVDRALNATTNAGTMAGTLSDQTFREGFSRGAAKDQTAQYNRDNTIKYQEGRVKHEQTERDSSIDREAGRFDASTLVNDKRFGRATTMFDAGGQVSRGKLDAAKSGNADALTGLQLQLGWQDAEAARKMLKQKEKGWLEKIIGSQVDPGNVGVMDAASDEDTTHGQILGGF